MEVLGYVPGNIPIIQEDLDHCRKWIEIYETKAAEYEAKAAAVAANQRGAYASHVVQCRKSAERMRQNLTTQESWVGNPWKLGQ